MFDSTLVSMICVHAQSCLTLCNPMDCSLPGSSFPWNFPGKNTAVGCHVLLQVIFQTQGSNPSLLHLLPWQAESTTLPLGEPCGCSGRRLQVAKAPSLHCASLPPRPPHSYMRQGDCENEILAMGPERRGTGFWGNSFRGHKESKE